jgi:hypothetical protein
MDRSRGACGVSCLRCALFHVPKLAGGPAGAPVSGFARQAGVSGGFDKFLEDWGPKNSRGDIQAARIVKTRSCDTGVIYTLEYGKQDPLLLWVERKDHALGFAPWPACDPRMPAPRP